MLRLHHLTHVYEASIVWIDCVLHYSKDTILAQALNWLQFEFGVLDFELLWRIQLALIH